MQSFWITFVDGTKGCCQGEGPYDAKKIAEHITGKKVAGSEFGDEGAVKIPYPADPVIWQFEHPVHGKCPSFCYSPEQCKSLSSCPKNYACTE